MKREERIRMLLHPEEHTDEQLARMLDETDIPVPDAKEEWAKLKTEKSSFSLRKIAAMFIGVLMLSGIAYAAIQLWKASPSPSIGGEVEIQPSAASGNQTSPSLDRLGEAPIRFDDVPLDSVLTVVASYYQKQVAYRNDSLHSLHLLIEWEPEKPLATFINLINNFEGIRISEANDTIIVDTSY